MEKMLNLTFSICLIAVVLSISHYSQNPNSNSGDDGMFFDEKTTGIEIIHHGLQISTGGAVRLQNTPEQRDLVPKFVGRKMENYKNSIEVTLSYEEFDFDSGVIVTAVEKGFETSLFLDKPMPEELRGRAGINMEYFPAAYFEKSYLTDGNPGNFPLYPAGNANMEPLSKKIRRSERHPTFEDRGRGEFIVPHPMAVGKTIVLAPEDPERRMPIQAKDTELMFFDGKNL